MRQKRKLDHLNLVCLIDDGPGQTGFSDIHFIPNCLPEIALTEINTGLSFLGRHFGAPLFINAISGGIPEAKEFNRTLASAARHMRIPMAVGSMTAALEDPAVGPTFTVVREENPHGFIAANVSAGTTPRQALEAVNLIRADALQLHLNAPQEAMMAPGEGDVSFRGFLENIRAIVRASPVPVIVKEVGFGMAGEQAHRLQAAGVAALDTGGSGGTNFIRLESLRRRVNSQEAEALLHWGLPSAVALREVVKCTATAGVGGAPVEIVAGGGIRSGLDVAKALALGATVAGIAGPLVRCYYQGGRQAVQDYLLRLQNQLRQVMFMLGSQTPGRLKNCPLVVLGDTGKWLELRGIDLSRLARRGNMGEGYNGNICGDTKGS